MISRIACICLLLTPALAKAQTSPTFSLVGTGSTRTLDLQDPASGNATALGTVNSFGWHPIEDISQTVSVAPAGNASISTLTGSVSQITGTAAHASSREFGEVRSFTSAYGYGSTGTPDKVVSYRSMVALQGTSDVWVDNTLLEHDTNGPINTHLLEADYNMDSTNKYSTTNFGHGVRADGTSFDGVSALGIVVTGLSPNGGIASAGFNVASADTNKLFQYGYSTGFGLAKAGYYDGSDAVNSYLDVGPHIMGLNLESGGYSSGVALAIPWQRQITSLGSDASRHNIISVDSTNKLVLGDSGLSGTVIASSLMPGTSATTIGNYATPFAATYTQMIAITMSNPPASSSATCSPGMVQWDANYVYVCVGTNTWRRSALASF